MINRSKILGMALLAVMSTGQAAETDTMRLIVKYKNSINSFSQLQKFYKSQYGISLQSIQPMAAGAQILRFQWPANLSEDKSADIQSVIDALRKNPDIQYVVRDRVGHFKPLPELTGKAGSEVLSHESQWDEFSAPAGVMLESAPGRADGAWAYTRGEAESPVVVAVLDTGVEKNDSLINSLLKDDQGGIWGWNFAANSADVSDDTGSYHGTHVSGTIAGYGHVMQGMGENLKVLTVKIPDASGMFYESAVINGIYWAVGADVPGVPHNPHPAKVLNMSFGVDAYPGKEIDYCDEALQDAVTYARDQGAVIMVAAGNDNQWEHYNAPAVCNGTVKVASTGPKGLRSYFSNYGPGVTLAGPGGDKHYGLTGGILSTVNPGGGYMGSGFAFYQGTSMATPHVAGLAGLIQAVSKPALSAEKLEKLLYMTTHDFGRSDNPDDDCISEKPCGHGIIDAEHAVKAAHAAYDVFLSAPKLSTATTAACKSGRFKASTASLQAAGQHWKLAENGCVKARNLVHPVISQDKEGRIFANYGAIQYQLDASSFKVCQKIGYDGLGCYF